MTISKTCLLAVPLCILGMFAVSGLAINCNVRGDRLMNCTALGTGRFVPGVERVKPTIFLNNSKIMAITENAFDTVDTVVILFLNDNFLVTLEERWFLYLVNLAIIDVSGNQIATYTPGTFKNVRSLQKFIATNNQLEIFNGTIDNFARTTIDLTNNPLNQILIERVHTLHLNNTNVTELHLTHAVNIFAEYAKIESFSMVEGVSDTLHLRGNNIRDLSNLTANFGLLQYLDVSQNMISAMAADAFTHLKGLRHLNISKIDMYEMYYGMFFNQRVLEVMDCSYNYLWHLNLNKIFPARLRELYVVGNAIWKVTDSRKVLRSLEKLGIAGNELSCERLFKIYSKGMDRGIEFVTPPHLTNHTLDNIAGMPCRNVQ